MKVVVTGAGGTIGRAVITALARAGARPRGVDRPGVSPVEGCAWIAADVTKDDLDEAFAGADACIHLAGRKAGRVAPDEVAETFVANVGGTIRVAEACRKAGAKRIVLASSGHVYGLSISADLMEIHPPVPASAYAASKRAAEVVIVGYAASAGLEGAIARIANVYGGPPDPDTIIGRALVQARDGRPIALRTHDSIRDFVHVDDVAAALVALTSCRIEGAEVFNVGSGVGIATGDVARVVAEAAGVAVLPPEAEEPEGSKRSVLAIDKLRGRCEWAPKHDIVPALAALSKRATS